MFYRQYNSGNSEKLASGAFRGNNGPLISMPANNLPFDTRYKSFVKIHWRYSTDLCNTCQLIYINVFFLHIRKYFSKENSPHYGYLKIMENLRAGRFVRPESKRLMQIAYYMTVRCIAKILLRLHRGRRKEMLYMYKRVVEEQKEGALIGM